MERRTVLEAAVAAVAAPGLVRVRAQTRARRIGLLYPGVDPGGPPVGAAAAWRQLGWIEGDTLVVERRYAAWSTERLAEQAGELLRRQVELLLTFGPEAAAAAARATRTTPIVFRFAYLPIECGLIDSYANPGRNCTGVAWSTSVGLSFKRLEFIRAISPSAHRLAALSSDVSQFTVSGAPFDIWSEAAAAARAQGFEFTIHIAKRVDDVKAALAEAAAARAQVVNVVGNPFVAVVSHVIDFALGQRWVTSTFVPELFDAGVLLYHGPSSAEITYMADRTLQMVDRVLRGAQPSEIPVELPTRVELALNLKTARALGLTLPQSLLLRADRVVD